MQHVKRVKFLKACEIKIIVFVRLVLRQRVKFLKACEIKIMVFVRLVLRIPLNKNLHYNEQFWHNNITSRCTEFLKQWDIFDDLVFLCVEN